MALLWPSVLIPSSEAWNPNKGASRSGGRSISNQEQVVVGPSGYVTARLTIPVNRREKVLAMRKLLAGLDGRAGTVLIGPCEGSRAPWFVDPLTGGKIGKRQGDRDAARDPAWDANSDTSADLDFRLAAPATMNGTTITIQRVRGGLLEEGMMFSLAGQLHVIFQLPNGDTGEPGPVAAVIRRWLQADYPAGTPIEFARPVCAMRRASEDDGELELQLSRMGTVTLDFVSE